MRVELPSENLLPQSEVKDSACSHDDELESIANNYRNHCIYLLALVKFSERYLRQSTKPAEMAEIKKKLTQIEEFLNENRVNEKIFFFKSDLTSKKKKKKDFFGEFK